MKLETIFWECECGQPMALEILSPNGRCFDMICSKCKLSNDIVIKIKPSKGKNDRAKV